MNNIFSLIYSIFVSACALAGTRRNIQPNPNKNALDLVSANKINAIAGTISCYNKHSSIPYDSIDGNHKLWDNLVTSLESITNQCLENEYQLSEDSKILNVVLCKIDINNPCTIAVQACTVDIYSTLFAISETNTKNIWKSMTDSEKKLINDVNKHCLNNINENVKNELFEIRKAQLINTFQNTTLKNFKRTEEMEPIDMEDIKNSLRLKFN
ncbi:uncharacterized protein LOC126896858 [Daktulosphaira vitifoliae]|uniref:uncharacterized protein LOC126896858 n=1 Tax=Daktulosphaira vitifoliae TaxID=58002 RepID=UPI0021A99F4B|nr:uncharacterized protein LOC126896858 [Daktulosphaira vitifoliae]